MIIFEGKQVYTIDELTGKAFSNALTSEREGEWDGNKRIKKQVLIDFSRMNGTHYDINGEFVTYHKSNNIHR